MPPFRFLALATCLALAGCATYPAMVLFQATLPDIEQLDRITRHLEWHIRPVQVSELLQLQLALPAVALLSGIAALVLSRSAYGRAALFGVRSEVHSAASQLRGGLQQLSPRQRLMAATALGLLLALRVYFSLTRPPHAEEVASYEFFVSQGLLAVSAYYPIPNNHILSNAISCLFYQAHPGFWWTMRLPVLLISTAGTVFWFAGLLRLSNFRVALLAIGLFSCLQLSLYHASAGRGYWLLISLTGIIFFSTFSLSRPGKHPHVASLGLLLAGGLGMYTIPTFAYVLASAFSWLGLAFLRQRRWADLTRVVLLGAAVLCCSVLFYSPLLLVSGPAVLVGNGFVAARPPAEFWAGLPQYLWFTEGYLAGQRSVGAGLWLAVLVVVAALLLNKLLPAPQRLLAGQAFWFVLVPVLLLMAQRVFPPERVLLYKALPFFLLAALVADWGLRWAAARNLQLVSTYTLAGSWLVFIGYQLLTTEKLSQGARPQVEAYRAAFRWLMQQPPGPVLAPEPLHNLYFRFFARTTGEREFGQFEAHARPGRHYPYVVAFPDKHGFFQPNFSFAPAYRSQQVEIYRIATP